MNQTEKNLERIRAYNRALDREYKRDANGQFASTGRSGGGKSDKGDAKKKAKAMLEAAFNQNWKMPKGKGAGEDMGKKLDESWTYTVKDRLVCPGTAQLNCPAVAH